MNVLRIRNEMRNGKTIFDLPPASDLLCQSLYRQGWAAQQPGVITLRYGLTGENPLTQREIAQQCGISRSYVSVNDARRGQKAFSGHQVFG